LDFDSLKNLKIFKNFYSDVSMTTKIKNKEG